MKVPTFGYEFGYEGGGTFKARITCIQAAANSHAQARNSRSASFHIASFCTNRGFQIEAILPVVSLRAHLWVQPQCPAVDIPSLANPV